MSWEITLLYFFSWNFIWFGQKEPIKGQHFRLLTAHVEFHQICTLIGSFCWKYIKFQLKKYRGVFSHGTEEWCKIWEETDLLLQKWQEFGEFWPKHTKDSKICTLIVSFCAKYLPFERLRSYVTWHRKVMQNMKKNTCGSENGIKNLANFHRSTWKCRDCDFDGILLSKVENAWAKSLLRRHVSWRWRMMKNLERNWLVISTLTWGTWQILTRALKSLKSFTLMAPLEQSIYYLS